MKPTLTGLRWPGLGVTLCQWIPRILGIVVAVIAVQAGWTLRETTFTYTAPVRFMGDISNGLHQGTRVLRYAGAKPKQGERVPLRKVLTGWVRMYDDLYARERQGAYSLDYTPLRLGVMALWAREVWHDKGGTPGYEDGLAGPLLKVNTGCELAASVGMFLLVRHWKRRASRVIPALAGNDGSWDIIPAQLGTPGLGLRSGWRAACACGSYLLKAHSSWVVALFCAALVWFNPAVIIGAHGFPQWDVWLLPFFVFACYAGSAGGWATAGFLIAVGSMFKGQGLMVAPVLAAWPLLMGRPAAALRLAVGAAAGVALTTWPWLVRSDEALRWMEIASAGACVFALVSGVLPRSGAWKWVRIPLLVLVAWDAALAMLYPARHWGDGRWQALAGGLALVALISLWVRPLRALPYTLVGVWAFGALLSATRFGGSASWLEIGFKFPTDHYQYPALGPTANINALLMHYYRWNLKDVMFRWGLHAWTLQESMRGIFFALLVPVAVMLAWHARRGSPRALACLAAPWVLMFACVPQMHERYLLWGAAFTAAAAAISTGMFLLHVTTTAIAFACIAMQILNTNGDWWPGANRLLSPMFPSMGWLTGFVALAYVHACLVPPHRTSRDRGRPPMLT